LLAFLVPALSYYLIRPFERQIEHGRNLAADLTEVRGQLEIRVVQRSAELSAANERLNASLESLERGHRELVALREMGALLQVCRTVNEAEGLLEAFAKRLFPNENGAVYVYRSSRNILERAVAWGAPNEPSTLEPDDCWALRCGEAYAVEREGERPRCRHIRARDGVSLCVPISAQGDIVGLLLLSAKSGQASGEGALPESVRRLASSAGQKIALALSNLKLREELRDQAIRDPLTRLFNRRYFEESFEREIARAERRGSSVGLIMLDVDRFKKFNDAFTHDGGDAVLRRVGRMIQDASRTEDIPCRYGGEEFALVLSDAPLDVLSDRAERLRQSIEAMQVSLHGHLLDRVTISCGLAVYPQHGATLQELIRAADEALYEAKASGRNRLVVASDGIRQSLRSLSAE
jgi:diguanylate cyclase (GGDEF)-like protein